MEGLPELPKIAVADRPQFARAGSAELHVLSASSLSHQVGDAPTTETEKCRGIDAVS
jgi:hypothetical protein